MCHNNETCLLLLYFSYVKLFCVYELILQIMINIVFIFTPVRSALGYITPVI